MGPWAGPDFDKQTDEPLSWMCLNTIALQARWCSKQIHWLLQPAFVQKEECLACFEFATVVGKTLN